MGTIGAQGTRGDAVVVARGRRSTLFLGLSGGAGLVVVLLLSS